MHEPAYEDEGPLTASLSILSRPHAIRIIRSTAECCMAIRNTHAPRDGRSRPSKELKKEGGK